MDAKRRRTPIFVLRVLTRAIKSKRAAPRKKKASRCSWTRAERPDRSSSTQGRSDLVAFTRISPRSTERRTASAARYSPAAVSISRPTVWRQKSQERSSLPHPLDRGRTPIRGRGRNSATRLYRESVTIPASHPVYSFHTVLRGRARQHPERKSRPQLGSLILEAPPLRGSPVRGLLHRINI